MWFDFWDEDVTLSGAGGIILIANIIQDDTGADLQDDTGAVLFDN